MNTCNNLQMLLLPWHICVPSIFIRELTLDSRCAFPGDLFIAINGHKNDGRCYISEAINKGVCAIISESDLNIYNSHVYHINDIPIVCLYNLKNYLSAISGRFYGYPSYSVDLVGVTGTNGKTTVTHLLSQWVDLLCQSAAVLGTIGNGIFHNLVPSVNTTASAIEIQKMLASFCRKGVTFVSMEVSSHALVQNRVHDLYFRAAVFTNLSHDHLDYHGNMLAYASSKWKLFTELHVEERIVNGDDDIGFQWLSKLFCATLVIWRRKLPSNWTGKWLRVISVHNHSSGFDIIFDSTWGKGLICSKLIGECNVINLLLALATLLTLNYPLSLLLEKAYQLHSVCGRMEIFQVFGFPTIMVDYAHTPDALKKVLLEIRLRCSGEVWCIFGCGGDRDRSKRFFMGEIAGKYSDYVIITDDNPRFENSQDIINDIKFGLMNMHSKYFYIISNRKEALVFVINRARQKDWILIAGKGHENYQIISGNKFVHSDRDIVKGMLGIDT